jgi:hypothetical protein
LDDEFPATFAGNRNRYPEVTAMDGEFLDATSWIAQVPPSSDHNLIVAHNMTLTGNFSAKYLTILSTGEK